MNNVNQTLYIPLYGKAYVSKKGLFLKDPKAEEIWSAEGFPLKGKAKSKWLAYYMGIRSAVFDRWLQQKLNQFADGVVVQIGCGMDSRNLRVDAPKQKWYDVDFPEVIRERKRYFEETDRYKMVAADIRSDGWYAQIPEGRNAIVVMEGVSMYLTPAEQRAFLLGVSRRFEKVAILMDCYTELAAKLSKYKNPINEVGVTIVYGMDCPEDLAGGTIRFVQEHDMTPTDLSDLLQGIEKRIFKKLYAGDFSRKLYRLFEYECESLKSGGN